MIIAVSSLFLAFSIFLAAILSFNPSMYRIVNQDFKRRFDHYSILYGFEYGQISARANTLVEGVTKTIDLGYLRKEEDRVQERLTCDVTLEDGKIEVVVYSSIP